MTETLREHALALDESDSLAHFRQQFHFPQFNGKDCIYLCGNSLGLQPKSTETYIQEELRNWQQRGVEGHFKGDKPWVTYHNNSKKALGNLLGAQENEVVAMNNLTTNLHLALTSFYRPNGKRTKIIIERGAFPSDYYAVHSQIVVNGLDPKNELIELLPEDGSDYLPTEEILSKIEEVGDELALILFPGIQYYTGQFFDLRAITEAAHNVGAYAGFDLAHAIANLPVTLHNDQADFAVWCTYKYLNSGPGAVGGLFIHEQHGKNVNMPRLSGWWGHDADGRFKMDNQINPIASVDGWQLSNSNIITHAAHLASLEIFEQADIHQLREKSVKLTGLLEELILEDDQLNAHLKIITPTNPEERGCQLSLYLTSLGKGVFDFLISNGVILDWREPNVIRVAPTPLYNSFSDVFEFVALLKKAVAHG